MTSRNNTGTRGNRFAVRLSVLLVPILALSLADAGAAVRASLDRSAVTEGEGVVLSIAHDGGADLKPPNLAPLERDFYLLGSSRSRQVQISNGRRSEKNLWTVQLEPRRLGRLEIPPLAVGEQMTQPLRLTVEALPEQTAGQADVFVEARLLDRQPTAYVQQQLRFQVRLYSDAPVLDGHFIDPAPVSAKVERLGNDRFYPAERNGKDYQVVERNYAVFASESGELQLPAVRFQGRLVDRPAGPQSAYPDSYGAMNDFLAGPAPDAPSRPVRARSEPLSLQIAALPGDYAGGHWLPAADLRLADDWHRQPQARKIGEPLSRRIRIDVKGLPGTQIPRLQIVETDGVQVYREQPFVQTRSDGTWVLGHSEQRLTYVPTKAGDLQIPAVRLLWWDTERNQQREAKLPGRRLQVLPAAGSSRSHPLPPAASAQTLPGSGQVATESPMPLDGGEQSLLSTYLVMLRAYWGWVLSAAVLLWVAVLARRRHHRERERNARELQAAVVRQQSRSEQQQALQRLSQACRENDASAAEHALLQLAALKWPGDVPRNLSALAQRLGSGAEAVRAVERALFSAARETWRGEALWQAFAKGIDNDASGRPPAHRDKMKPLHPGYT